MTSVDLIEPSPELLAGPPAQLVLLPAQEPEPDPVDQFLPGAYQPYCEIMRALVSVQTDEAMLLRVRIALALARWPGAPPGKLDIALRLGVEAGDLSWHLSGMRDRGLIKANGDDSRYELSSRGRAFMMGLHVLANELTAGDTPALAKGFFELSRAVDLDLEQQDVQFEMLVAALDGRVRAMHGGLLVDDTQQVRTLLTEARRDRTVGLELLGLMDAQDHAGAWRLRRERRMHEAIAHIGTVSSRLETHYRRLIRRDLISSGLVSVGDMRTWVQGASIEDLAEAITPFLTAPLEPLTETSAEGLIEGWRDLQEVRDDAADLVSPAPVATPEVETADILDAGLIKMAGLERRLRAQIAEHGPLRLGAWVDEPDWRAATLRFMVATDPAIETGSDGVYLTPDADGAYDHDLRAGAVRLVTRAMLAQEARDGRRHGKDSVPDTAAPADGPERGAEDTDAHPGA